MGGSAPLTPMLFKSRVYFRIFTYIRFKCKKSHGISYGLNSTPSSVSEVSGAFVPSVQWHFAPESQYLEEAKKDGLREPISHFACLVPWFEAAFSSLSGVQQWHLRDDLVSRLTWIPTELDWQSGSLGSHPSFVIN